MTAKMSMIERVARAICKEGSHCCQNEGRPTCWASGYEDAARAAIEAMRVPTPAMIEAGRWAAEEGGAETIWSAMIDAALREEPAGPI